MENIEKQCRDIETHIKKAKSNLKIFMYTTNGVMFMLMSPFVHLHKKHFNKVQDYVKILNSYVKDKKLDISFNEFCESENSAILYNQDQLGSLTIKQYEMRLKYLNTLNEKVETLKRSI